MSIATASLILLSGTAGGDAPVGDFALAPDVAVLAARPLLVPETAEPARIAGTASTAHPHRGVVETIGRNRDYRVPGTGPRRVAAGVRLRLTPGRSGLSSDVKPAGPVGRAVGRLVSN